MKKKYTFIGIKGMNKLPECCAKCRFYDNGDCALEPNAVYFTLNPEKKRNPYCLLMEVNITYNDKDVEDSE